MEGCDLVSFLEDMSAPAKPSRVSRGEEIWGPYVTVSHKHQITINPCDHQLLCIDINEVPNRGAIDILVISPVCPIELDGLGSSV